jgi:hypothetical protein
MAFIQSTKDPLDLNDWEALAAKAPIIKGFNNMFNKKFEAFYNIEDACHNLGFDFYDNTEDPTLFNYREKRD